MATLERTYNVPLRRKFVRSPKYKRSKRAVTILKEFIAKHMKAEEVKIGRNLNEFLWKNGIQNPPHHVKVQLVKDDKGVVRAELFGKKYEEPTNEDREKAAKEKPKSKKLTEKVEQKPELADQAVKNQKGLKEEAAVEKQEEEIQKEEELPEHVREEEEDIKEGVDAVKEEPKAAAKPKAKSSK